MREAHERTVSGGRRVRQLVVPSPVGDLEGVLFCGAEEEPRAAAVFCHPHPQFGGTLHNKVTYRAAETLFLLGLPVLRFNFRGVGQSAGVWSEGAGEEEDAVAALDYVEQLYPGLPLLLGGFSFGAGIALAVGTRDDRVPGVLAVAPSPRRRDLSFLADSPKPKAIVQGTADELCPLADLEAAFPSWAEPKRLWLVPGAGHFFEGRIPDLRSSVREAAVWLPLGVGLGLAEPAP